MQSFDAAFSHFQFVDEQHKKLLAQQRTALNAIKAVLVQHVLTQREVFAELLDDRDLPREIQSQDRLDVVQVKDDQFYAVFECCFRGEGDSYELEIPLRYLVAGGKEVMVAEAQELQQKQEHDQRAALDADLLREQRQYEALALKFGPLAPAAQPASPPLPHG